MSLFATTYVLHRRYGNQTRKLIMIGIADFANDEGEAWPSIDTLADRAECSRRSVQEHLIALKKSGELLIQDNAGPRGTHVYKIVFQKKQTPPAPPQEPQKGGAEFAPHADPAPVQISAQGVQMSGADLHTNRKEPKKKDSPLPPQSGGTTQPDTAAPDFSSPLLTPLLSLRPEWAAVPALSRRERRLLRDNAAVLHHVLGSHLQLIHSYLHARIPEGQEAFQPTSRQQFLAHPQDVLAKAIRWQQKRRDRSPAPSPAHPKPSTPPPSSPKLTREEIRQMGLRPV